MRSFRREHARFEPRLERAFVKAAAVARARLPIVELAAAIGEKNLRAAEAIATRAAIEAALVPAGAIVLDATLRGGQVAAELVPLKEK